MLVLAIDTSVQGLQQSEDPICALGSHIDFGDEIVDDRSGCEERVILGDSYLEKFQAVVEEGVWVFALGGVDLP